MISTLVAGIDALRGSKSPIDAMFRKLLFILKGIKIKKTTFEGFPVFSFPVLCSPAPFTQPGKEDREELSERVSECLLLLLLCEKWSKGARAREKGRET